MDFNVWDDDSPYVLGYMGDFTMKMLIVIVILVFSSFLGMYTALNYRFLDMPTDDAFIIAAATFPVITLLFMFFVDGIQERWRVWLVGIVVIAIIAIIMEASR